jgi:predicted amidohydrolase YtcJ
MPLTKTFDALMTAEGLQKEVRLALKAGLDIATHAIGDAAVARVLQVYAGILQTDHSVVPSRLRIEHFSIATPADMRRAAQLGVLLSIQPGFVWPDDDGVTMQDSRIGKEHTTGAYAWATLAGMGARMMGSSDDFTVPGPPLWNFYAAVTRKNPGGKPPEGWHSGELLPRKSAIRLFTDSVLPGGEYSNIQLRADAPANLVVLSADPFAAAESDILSIKVNATIRAGQITFSDGSLR